MRPLPARLPACRRRPAPAVERAVRRVVCRRCGARKPPTFVNFSSRAGELASGCTRVKATERWVAANQTGLEIFTALSFLHACSFGRRQDIVITERGVTALQTRL